MNMPNPPTNPLNNVSFFKGADGMDASSKLPFLPSGFIGRVRVDATKGITKRDGERAFIAEFTVLTTNLPDRVYAGGRYSWFQSLKEPGTAYPACIGFLYAALGLDTNRHKATIESKIKPQQDAYLNMAANKPETLAGAEINIQTSEKTTKKGTPFTLHTFTPTAEGVAKADETFAK